MKISDLITQRILQLMEEQDGIAEIQRNEFAGEIGCVPSQINYVLTSRFTPEQGYTIESRRGAGGTSASPASPWGRRTSSCTWSTPSARRWTRTLPASS